MLTGKTCSTQGKACRYANLSSTDMTRADLGYKPGLCSGRPQNKHLSHCTANWKRKRMYVACKGIFRTPDSTQCALVRRAGRL